MNREICKLNNIVADKVSELSDVENYYVIETWDTFTKEFEVIPHLYSADESDDIHISTEGKVQLGRLWLDPILQSLKDGSTSS